MEYDVQDFGAKGDGVTDDRAAIQAAVDAAHAAGGGTVVLPPGTYIVSGQANPSLGCIMLYSDISIVGAGMGQTTVKLQDGFNGNITGMFRDHFGVGSSNISVSGLTIDGNRAHNTGKIDGWFSGTAPGSTVQDHNITLDHVEVKDCNGYGFDPHEQTVGLTITNCVSHGNGLDGFTLDFQIGATITNNVAYGNDRHGFNIVTSSHDVDLTDNVAYGNGGAGIMVQRGSTNIPVPDNINITGGSLYGNALDGIQINKADHVTIDGVDIHDNGQRGVRIIGSIDTIVRNSTLHDDSQAKNLGYPEISIESYNDTAGASGRWYYSRGVQILNNAIYDTGGIHANYGVREYADGSDYTIVSGTTIAGMAHNAPFFSGLHSLNGLPGVTYAFGTDAGDLIHGGDTGPDVITGFLGNDSLYGGASNDVISGGQGNDALFGGDGADTYVFSLGDGNDVITNAAGLDRIVFDATVSPAGVSYQHSLAPGSSDLIITYGSGDTITVSDFFADGQPASLAAVQFADGTEADFTLINAAAHIIHGVGPSGVLYAFDNGDTTIYGTSGNDIMTGAGGNDSLIGANGNDQLQGGLGDDTFRFSAGDGQDTLADTGGADAIIFDATVSSAAVSYAQSGADLVITDGLGDSVTVSGFFAATASQIEAVRFSDGTSVDAATIIQQTHTWTGTSGADSLAATGDAYYPNDWLYGLDGNDALTGAAGNDILDGGSGADTMTGGAGNDSYYVADTTDRIVEQTGQGVDTVYAAVTYTLSANVDNVVLTGNTATNAVGNDLGNLIDSAQDAAANALAGGLGDDIYIVGAGDRIIEAANAGIDTVISAQSWTLYSNLENLTLQGAAVSGTGNTQDNYIIGTSGDNVLDGKIGADTLAGGAGNDTYFVDHAGDLVIENPGEGTDTVVTTVSYTLSSDVENLILTGAVAVIGTGNDLDNGITGNSTYNKLYGAAGNDVLDGGAGADSLYGGTGNDTYYVDRSSDLVVENTGEGADLVYAASSYILSANLEDLTQIGNQAINATGNAGDNHLTGNNNANVLTGADGNDSLYGAGGNDVLSGGAGNDALSGQAGLDTMFGGLGADTFVLQAASAYDAVDVLRDFHVAEGDSIDITDLLAAYDPLTGPLSDFVHIVRDHSNSLLMVDADGSGSGATFHTVLLISNLINLDPDTLVAGGNLFV